MYRITKYFFLILSVLVLGMSFPVFAKTVSPVKKVTTTKKEYPALEIKPVVFQPITVEGPMKDDVIFYGYVRDSKTKQPLQDAYVGLSYLGDPDPEIQRYITLHTDAQGRFEWDDTPGVVYASGHYSIFVSPPTNLPQFVSYQYEPMVRDDDKVVIDVQKTQRLDIALFNNTMTEPLADAILYGHVYDAKTKQPLSNAHVSVYFKSQFGSFNMVTNQDGFYQLSASAGVGYACNRYLNKAPEFLFHPSTQVDNFWVMSPLDLWQTYDAPMIQYPTKGMQGTREFNFYLKHKPGK